MVRASDKLHRQVGRADRVFLHGRLGAERWDSLLDCVEARTDKKAVPTPSLRRPLSELEEYPTDRDNREIDCKLRKTSPVRDGVQDEFRLCVEIGQSMENESSLEWG